MFAVYGAIIRQEASLRGAHILVQSDKNTRIRKEGSTLSLTLLNLTTRLMVEHNSLSGVPLGEVQRHSRPPAHKQTHAGMASVAPGLGGLNSKVGRPRRGPFLRPKGRPQCGHTSRGTQAMA